MKDPLPCRHTLQDVKWIKNPTDATVCRYLFTAKLLYMFRVSQHPSSGVSKTVPRSLRYRSYYLYRYSPPTWSGLVCTSRVLGMMMGAVTPETCRVALQWINICILLHLLDFLFTLNYDARNHELKGRKVFAGRSQCLVWRFTDVKCLLVRASARFDALQDVKCLLVRSNAWFDALQDVKCLLVRASVWFDALQT